MPGSLNITLTAPAGERLTYHLGSLLHGLIMETIEPAAATELHGQGLKPFSQHLEPLAGGEWLWQINTLSEQAWQDICLPLLKPELKAIQLKDKNYTLAISSKEQSEFMSYRELVRRFYLSGSSSRRLKIRFLSPCSFKTRGSYAIFPEVNLIYQNLISRFDAFAGEFLTQDTETLDHLIDHTTIVGYRLRSTRFDLEGVHIPSFWGEIALKISGPETLVNLANLLLYFGNWSGIGIKTALGMGAVNIE